MAAIFCFAFTTTLQGCTPASTSIHNRPNRVTTVILYNTASTLSLARDLHYGTLFATSATVNPLTPISIVSIVCPTPSIQTCLTALSELGTWLVYIYLCHLEHERGLQCCSPWTTPCTAVDTRHRSVREIVTYPYSSPVCGKCQDSVVHQRLLWCSTGVISPDTGEVGKGVVRCLIMDSTRLLIGNTSTIFCAEYLDLKQSAMNPSSKSSKSSGCLHGQACLPSYVSLYITWSPSLSLDTCIISMCHV